MKQFATILLLVLATIPVQSRDWNTLSRRESSYPMYFSVGAGGQTYIGNEDISDARHNAITPNLYLEWGYSLTPEIALALNLHVFMAQSQTRYRINPYVDISQHQPESDGYYPYQSFTFYGGTLSGLVVLDWTNIVADGYYKQAKLRVLTPIGMGITVGTGAKKNPLVDYSPVNRELSFTAGFSIDYRINEMVALSCSPRIYIMRGSLDYSPYSDNQSARIDMIPSLTLGARFTLNARIPWISR